MSRPLVELDHIVITCHRLKAGIDYVSRVFGVSIPEGGQHHFMGTHNAVMAIGDGVYLEVIAIDPTLPAPPYPRWFGLGNIMWEDQLKDKPLLAHYVMRTTDINASLARLDKADAVQIGPPHSASRGDLTWQITLSPTGLPPEGGCLPALIEWDGTPPVGNMAFPGPKLEKLRLLHPDPAFLHNFMDHLDARHILDDGKIEIEQSATPGLKADFINRQKSIWI